ncbi:hypothetical protein ACE0DR_09310 [Azotobacter sp. CWF10]
MLDNLKGRDLGLGELQQAARRLSNYYHQRGKPGRLRLPTLALCLSPLSLLAADFPEDRQIILSSRRSWGRWHWLPATRSPSTSPATACSMSRSTRSPPTPWPTMAT